MVVVFAGGSSDDRAEINQKDCNSYTQHTSVPVRLLLSWQLDLVACETTPGTLIGNLPSEAQRLIYILLATCRFRGSTLYKQHA